MIKQLTLTVIALAGMTAVAPASAQFSRPTEIKGSVDQKAKVDQQIALAIDNSKAVTCQSCVYEDSKVGGDVKQDAVAKQQIALAISNSYASAAQSSVGVPKP